MTWEHIGYKPALGFPALVLILAAGFGASSCEGLQNEEYPRFFKHEVKVLLEGRGEDLGEELFPLAPGYQWTYISQEGPLVVRVEESQVDINNESAALCRALFPGRREDLYYRLDSRGFWDYGTNFKIHAPSLPRLQFPMRVGKSWTMESLDGNLFVQALAESWEEVGTAAGVFRALKVVYLINEPQRGEEQNTTETYWFAPGVGVVKMQKDDQEYLLRSHTVNPR